MNVILKKWQQSRWIEMPALAEGELLRQNKNIKKGLAMGMRLAVLEDQAAFILAEERLVGVFLPGAYQLEQDKFPPLTPDPKYDWRYPAEVYFLNTGLFVSQPWQPLAPLLARDAEYGLLQLAATGIYTAQVDNAALFVQQMILEQGYRSWRPIHQWLRSRLSELAIRLAASGPVQLQRLDLLRERYADALYQEINLELAGTGLAVRELRIHELQPHPSLQHLLTEPSPTAEHKAYNQAIMRSILR